jgi:hypothetical protein
MFYVFPVFAGPTDAMGMVLLIIMATLLASFVLGVLSGKKTKYLYPVVISIIFIPTVFIWYNESALIHSVWYLVISAFGLLTGSAIRAIVNLIRRKIKG